MKSGVSSGLILHKRKVPVFLQSAALCYRIEKGRTRILLVTTRRGRRWIIPKGWLIDGLSPAETAAQEAWEEAGVTGQCATSSLGRFSYLKQRLGIGPVFCVVDVFPLHVQSEAAQFPESKQRRCRWLSTEKAAKKVIFPEVAAMLSNFRPYHN